MNNPNKLRKESRRAQTMGLNDQSAMVAVESHHENGADAGALA